MNNKLISVIVPVYNTEKYLAKCIGSILNQSYTNLELILVDDGSTDSSGNICDEFASRDSRIKVLHQNNAGHQVARNAGIEMATGVYISFIDSDDFIDSKMYEILLGKIGDADLITSGLQNESTDGLPLSTCVDNYPPGIYNSPKEIDYIFNNLLLFSSGESNGVIGGLSNNAVDKIFKTSIVKKMYKRASIGIRLEEDYLFCMLYALLCTSFVVTNDIYYHYIKHSDSITAHHDRHFISDREKVYHALYDAITGHQYEGRLKEQLDKRTAFFLFSHYASKIGFTDKPIFPTYDFPDYPLIFNKRIVLFGAGTVGKSYHFWIKKHNIADIVLWVDNKLIDDGKNIIQSPKKILVTEYDYIVIAVLNENTAEDIKQQLYDLNVEQMKVIWYKPQNVLREIYL